MQIDTPEVLRFDESHLPRGCQIFHESAMTIYHVIPVDAGFGWCIELFDIVEKVAQHYHCIQTQFILLLEGRAKFQFGIHNEILRPGQYILVTPKTLHAIIPEKTT